MIQKVALSIFRLALFAIIPIAMFFLRETFLEYKGLYWTQATIDGPYAYLINSLNIAFFNGGIGHTDHPGTPMQLIGAFVIWFTYVFRYKELDSSNSFIDGLQIDVLSNPEIYLDKINLSFVAIGAMVIFILGHLVYKYSNSIIHALIIQGIPLYTYAFLGDSITNISAESLMTTACILMLGYTYLHNAGLWKGAQFNLTSLAQTEPIFTLHVDAILFGIFCGFGVATKINFVPYCIIPMIILWNRKGIIQYILSTGFSFLFFVAPLFFGIINTLRFWGGISTHTGIYGQGEVGVIDSNILLNSLYKIACNNPGIVGMLLVTIPIFIHILYKGESWKEVYRDSSSRYLLALFTALFGTLVITSKHYSGDRYLLPTFILFPFIILGLLDILSKKKIAYSSLKKGLLYSLPIFFLIFTVLGWQQLIKDYTDTQRENLALVEKIKPYKKDHLIVYSYDSPDLKYALHFGDGYGRFLNAPTLKKLYGDSFYCNFTYNRIYHWEKLVSPEYLMDFQKDLVIVLSDENAQQYLEKLFNRKVTQDGKLYFIENNIVDTKVQSNTNEI